MTKNLWPVYSGRSFEIWNPDTGDYYSYADVETITAALQDKRERSYRRANSAFAGFSQEWISDPDTLPCTRARVMFRSVARATDTRTIIAALVPPRIVAANQAVTLLRADGTEHDEAFLLGMLCSLVTDWYARRVVNIQLSFYLFNNIPIPDVSIDPITGNPIALRLVEISGRLAAVDDRFSDWAAAVGVPVSSANDPSVKQALIEELDACVAHLYGLDEDDLACLYETFDSKRPDRYAEHHAAVIKHFRRLAKS